MWTKEVKIADQNNMIPYKGLKFYDPSPFPGSKFHDLPLPKMSQKHHLYYVNFMHDRATVYLIKVVFKCCSTFCLSSMILREFRGL